MKSKIHVFSRMFARLTPVNMFLFILFAMFAVPSAWANSGSLKGTIQSVSGGELKVRETDPSSWRLYGSFSFNKGDQVTLIVESGSLRGLKVKYRPNGYSDSIAVKYNAYLGNGYVKDSIVFIMPESDVVVTPVWGSGFYNMPEIGTTSVKIPEGVSSFKVYDDGGASGNYNGGYNFYNPNYMDLIAPAGYGFHVTGTIDLVDMDDFYVYEGLTHYSFNSVLQKSGYASIDATVNTNTMSFGLAAAASLRPKSGAGLDLTVTLVAQDYRIVIENPSEGGSISSNVNYATKGSVITLTAKPSSGYILKSVSVINTETDASVATYGGWDTNNKVTFTMPAARVKVTPVFVKDTYTITYKKDVAGSATGATSATVGSTVAVTAKPLNSSYFLKDLIVSSENETVDVTSLNWVNNSASFIMPFGNTTVTPVFTNDFSAEGGLYFKIPKSGTMSATIPAKVKSFKVYDNGGKSGNYSENASGMLYLTAPDGYVLLLTGNVNTYNSSDYLEIYNGFNTSNADSLLGVKSGSSSTCRFYSNARRMALKFVSDGSNNSSGLDLTVTLVKLDMSLDNDGTSDFVNMIYQHKATFYIPSNVSSFKVYDEGGKSGNYSNNGRDTLVLIAPANHVLQLTGNVSTAYSGDTLEVYTGSVIKSDSLLSKKRSTSSGSSLDIGKVFSKSRYMTLYFKSDATSNYAGLDLTVKVVDDANSIAVIDAEGGEVECVSSAKIGSKVTLTVTSDDGYLLSGIDVVDGDGNTVKLTSGGNFANPTATFIMPAVGPVTVTPHFTKDLNVAGDLYINMPTGENKSLLIPSGVESFKVYDDGGKDGYYSNSYEHSLRLTPPSGYILQLEGSINTYNSGDYLTVKDYADGRVILDNARSLSGKSYAASLWLTFHSDASGNSSGLDLTVTVVPEKKVTVNTATGGNVQPSSKVATPGSTVTLTATMNSGYYFESVDIRDAEDKKISYSLDYQWYSSNSSATITFVMPSSDVSVTPKFTKKLTAENAMAINIPASGTKSITVPAAVKSFKVYDNGGANGDYSNNNNGTLALTAPTGYVFELTGSISTYISNAVEKKECVEWGEYQGFAACEDFVHWNVNTCDAEDNLNVYDGANVSATPLLQGKLGCGATSSSWHCRYDYLQKEHCDSHSNVSWISVGKILSSSNKLTLNFKSGTSGTAAGLNLTVALHKISTDELEDDGDGNQYVNMILSKKTTVNIPSGVTSFKIYDDGGKNGAYNNNNADTLVLKAPIGSYIELTGSINTYIIKTEEGWYCNEWASGFDVNVCATSDNWYKNTCDEGDYLSVYDGSTPSSSPLLQGKYGCSATSAHWTCTLNYLSITNPNCGTHSNVSWLSVGTLRSTSNTMTLVFKSNSSGKSDGLDLTAKVVWVDYAIQVNGAQNGKMLASKTTKLHASDTVSLIAVPNSGYMLKDAVAEDLSGNKAKISQYSFSVSELVMPAKDLIIKPTFTNNLTAAGGLHLDMRKNKNFDASVPGDIKSFKIYDNGGKDSAYEANSNDTLTLAAPEGYRMILTGSVNMENNGWEYLYVYDGNSTKAQNLLSMTGSANKDNTTSSKSIGTVTSSDRYMTIRFKSDGSNQYDGLDLTVTLEKIKYTITKNVDENSGKTLYGKDNDTLGAEIYLTGSDLFSNVSVVDKNNKSVKVTTYTFDRARFTMPASNVTVTPTWATDFTAEGGLHLDMQKNKKWDMDIPSKVKSFYLYDNGGKNGYYEANSNDTLTLNAPAESYLVVTGSFTLEKGGDSLYIFDGTTISATKLYGGSNTTNGATYSIPTITSSGRSLTFYFKSNGSYNYSGFNLKVSVVPIEYEIAVDDPDNGRVECDKSKAAMDSLVTLQWEGQTGYILRDVDVEDASKNKIAVNGGWYSQYVTFSMPNSRVTVTPSFTNNWTAEGDGGLYINMPKVGTVNAEIPAKVKSFKVYDDGGASANYASGCNGTLVLNVPEGYLLELSGSVTTENPNSSGTIYDYLDVYDGADNTATKLVNKKTGSTTISAVRSSSRNLTLLFHSDGGGVSKGLDLTVTLVKPIVNMTVANIASQTYTGSAICPDVVVKDGDAVLEKNTDYTVACSDNINVGTATATITGIGNYTGNVVKTFTIIPEFTPWIGSVADATTPAKVETGLENETHTAGYWYVLNDNEDGGQSKVVWGKTPLTTNIVPACQGICGTANLEMGSMLYNPWVLIGFDIVGRTSANSPSLASADVSAWEGVCLTYRSEKASELLLGLGDYDEAIGYAYPAVSLPATHDNDGQRICARWSEFVQPGWARKAKISGEEAAERLVSLYFRIQGNTGKYKFNICAVGPYGSENELPQSCQEPLKLLNLLTVTNVVSQTYTGSAICPEVVVKDGEAVLEMNADYTVECSNNVDVGTATVTITGIGDYTGEVVKTFKIIPKFTPWIGTVADATKPAKVETGLDNETLTAGYWYVLNDNDDGGLSKAVLGKNTLTTNIAPSCGGICGTAELDRGTLIIDPWVKFVFDIVGRTSANSQTLATEDVSAWEGVCLTYRSEKTSELLLGLGDYDEAIGYANPAVSLPATNDTKGQRKCVRWSEFEQPGWAHKEKISGEEAAERLASLQFWIRGTTGKKYRFNICAVGPYGSENELPQSCPEPLKPLNLLTVENVVSQTYTGSAICPDVVVKDVDAVLEKNTDYTVTCSDNINVGTATVTITGIGDYTGTVSKQFTIIPKVVNDFAAVTIEQDENGTFAVIDGNYSGTDVVEIKNEIKDVPVVYNRSFPANAYSTIMLPFDVNTANIEGPDAVLRYNGIKTVNNVSSIRMKVVWATDKWVVANGIKDANDNYKQYPDVNLNANTPYLVQMGDATSEDGKTVALKVNGTVTIKKTADTATAINGWKFRGTWQYKRWDENDSELGFAYGFAASASETNNIKVGDFVKVGVGAWILPLRAYLVKAELPEKSAQLARANGAYVKRPTVVPEELPELMSIVIDGDDDNEEHTTVIGHFNTRTGEIKMNYDRGKFDLKGRRVNGEKPNARGAYYGKKILKK